MNQYAELLRHLPASGIAGAFVPIAQFVFERLKARQSVHRKRELRESVLALNSFIRSITDVQEIDGHHAGCLEDALRERGLILKQLESLIAAESGRSRRLPAMSPIQRWFLLYAPSRPIGWALRWAFFTLLILTAAGVVRGLLHLNYLPTLVLVPFLIGTFILTVLARLAVLHVEGAKPRRGSELDRGTETGKARAGA